jgi:LPS export ABC transporter protein LptC
VRQRWLLPIVVVLAAAGGACAETTPPPVAQGATAADTASQFMLGVSFRIHDGGLLRADVLADTAYFFDDNTRLDLRNVQAVFYTSTGARDGVLTSAKALYDLNSQLMEAFGDVLIVSVDGRRLTTPQLRFDRGLNQLSSDTSFTATGPDGNTSGIGFTSDPGMNNLRIKRAPSGSAGVIRLGDRR